MPTNPYGLRTLCDSTRSTPRHSSASSSGLERKVAFQTTLGARHKLQQDIRIALQKSNVRAPGGGAQHFHALDVKSPTDTRNIHALLRDERVRRGAMVPAWKPLILQGVHPQML